MSRTFYLKNGRGERVVCIVASLVPGQSAPNSAARADFRVGISVWNGQEKHNRKFARDIALKRSVKVCKSDWDRFTVHTSPNNLLKDILERVLVNCDDDYLNFTITPGKLVRAAKRTLKALDKKKGEVANKVAEAETQVKTAGQCIVGNGNIQIGGSVSE